MTDPSAFKPLEWSETKITDSGYSEVSADTEFGPYKITWKGWKSTFSPIIYRPDGLTTVDTLPGTLEEAKADAQADYLASLRQAIQGGAAMTSMVEKVAQAIADNINAALPDGVEIDARYAALAAIEAMMEPTPRMISEGESAATFGIGRPNDDEAVPRVWKWMLQAALKEKS